MQLLEVSCAVRHIYIYIYMSLGAKGLMKFLYVPVNAVVSGASHRFIRSFSASKKSFFARDLSN